MPAAPTAFAVSCTHLFLTGECSTCTAGLFPQILSSRLSLLCLLCCPLSLPTSEVPLAFPLSLPGVSVGPHRSLLLLGVLGPDSVCGCDQRHCAGEVAVFLKALSPLAQRLTQSEGHCWERPAASLDFRVLELCSKISISNLR